MNIVHFQEVPGRWETRPSCLLEVLGSVSSFHLRMWVFHTLPRSRLRLGGLCLEIIPRLLPIIPRFNRSFPIVPHLQYLCINIDMVLVLIRWTKREFCTARFIPKLTLIMLQNEGRRVSPRYNSQSHTSSHPANCLYNSRIIRDPCSKHSPN